MSLRFFHKPREARAYVYTMTALLLLERDVSGESAAGDGLLLGKITHEADRQLVIAAIKDLQEELVERSNTLRSRKVKS